MYTVTPSIHNFLRADNDSNTPSNGLSHQNIIIIATCASLGGLAVLYVFYRTVRSLSRSSGSTPLPPVQPLAHHREQQLAKYDNVAQVWRSSSYMLALPPSLGESSSSTNVSLLKSEKTRSSAHTSFTPTSEGAVTAAASDASQYTLPHANSELPATAMDPLPSPLSSGTSDARSRASLKRTPSAPRTRPLSLSSSYASRNTVRGMPHDPHSNIQIVLPAPLAPGAAASSVEGFSFVDKWASYSRSDGEFASRRRPSLHGMASEAGLEIVSE